MLKVLKLEIFKLKRSKVLLITTLLPLLTILLGRFDLGDVEGKSSIEIWKGLFQGSLLVYSAFVFPILITVILAMLANIEYSNNGWKQLFSLPVKRARIFLSKLIVSLLIIIYSLIILWIGLIGTGLMVGAGRPIPFKMIICRTLFSYLSALPIFAIQFYLSFTFSNLSVPLALGIGFTLPSILAANSTNYWIFYPWTYPINTVYMEIIQKNPKIALLKGIVPVIFLLIIFITFIQFQRREVL